jgi:hypothetical protein
VTEVIDYLITQASAHVDLYVLTATLAAALWYKIARSEDHRQLESERAKQAIKEVDRKVMFLWDVIGKRATDKLDWLQTRWEKEHRYDPANDPDRRKE